MSTTPNSDETGSKGAGRLLLRGSLFHFLAFALNFAAAFYLMPFLIHAFGERGYGIWVLIGTIAGQLGLFDIGLMTTTERFMAGAFARGADDEANAVYSTSMAIFVLIAIAVFGIVIFLAWMLPGTLKDPSEVTEFRWGLIISGLNGALLFPFAILQGALAAKLRSDALTITQIIGTLVRLLFAITVVRLGHGIAVLALSVLLASLVERLLLGIVARRVLPQVRFHWKAVDRSTARKLIAFGRYIFLSKLGDAARYRLDNLIIAPIAGVVAVTHYAVASRLADYFQEIVWRISSVSFPVYAEHFAQGDLQGLREKLLTLSRFGAAICCLFATSAILFGQPFLALWLGRNFGDSYVVLCLLVVAELCALMQNPSRDVLRIIYKHAFDANTNTLEVCVKLALTLLLVPRLGILGAAIGTAFPMIITKGIILPRYVCRHIQLSPLSYYRNVGLPVGISIAIGVPCWWLLRLAAIDSLAVLMAIAALFAAILGAVLLISLPRGDRRALARAAAAAIPAGRLPAIASYLNQVLPNG